MLTKPFLKSKPICKVTFTLPETIHAETVHLVGGFNHWDEKSTPMKRGKNGQFSIALDLEMEHKYQFRYLVNGTDWHTDWDANRYEPNRFSGDNSVVMT